EREPDYAQSDPDHRKRDRCLDRLEKRGAHSGSGGSSSSPHARPDETNDAGFPIARHASTMPMTISRRDAAAAGIGYERSAARANAVYIARQSIDSMRSTPLCANNGASHRRGKR